MNETFDSRSPRRRRTPGVWTAWTACILAGSLAGACSTGSAAEPGGMSDDTFVAVFVSLRRAAAEESSDEAFARRRDEILQEYAVTEEGLERFIDVRSDDLEALSELWDRIDRTLRGELELDGTPIVAPGRTTEDDGGDA